MTHHSLESERRKRALDEIASIIPFRSIQWVESIDSTNSHLSQEIKDGRICPPAILVATTQTRGAGRGGNDWFSPAGCLMFSLAISLDDANSSLLPLRFGFAVAKAIEPLVRFKPQIKWPNDVYIDGRKVCGILIEAISSSVLVTKPGIDVSGKNVAIIGAGVNCLVDFESMPILADRATSLHKVSKIASEDGLYPEDVLVRIVQAWKQCEDQRAIEGEWWLQQWQELSLLHHQWITVQSGQRMLEGLCVGIDTDGGLLLADSKGRVERILAGSIVDYRSA
jgi:BirA family biotin operon repressor/biotin-[acetyl-CoA-carboxylase] ligase